MASAITQSGEGAGSWVRILTSKGGQLALELPEPARSCLVLRVGNKAVSKQGPPEESN